MRTQSLAPPLPPRRLQWDIFCHVIDNHGDLGVCWRLACQAAARGDAVRLWVDDAAALSWMAPHGCAGVEVFDWGGLPATNEAVSDVWIEAFGCEITPDFIAACAQQVSAGATKPLWLNLEYLSAETWVARCHGLPSPVQHGPAKGWTKWFFYPGFTEQSSGGLLRETDFLLRQEAFDRSAWRAQQVVKDVHANARWVSLFCYEPQALGQWLQQCASALPLRTQLLVTAGRAERAVHAALQENLCQNSLQRLLGVREQLSILNIPALTQLCYDELLWGCDLNFVRGEDSLVRALLAGRPFVWHVYPQHDGAHAAKLNAFLEWLQAPPSLRKFHAVWNGLSADALPLLDDETLTEWAACASAARLRILEQSDLLTRLLGFYASHR